MINISGTLQKQVYAHMVQDQQILALPNLLRWWRADQGVDLSTDNVWTDRVGGHLFTAPTSARPSMGVGLKGLPALHFTGANSDLLRTTDTVWSDTDKLTILLVGNLELCRGGFTAGWNFIFPAFDGTEPGGAGAGEPLAIVLTSSGENMYISTGYYADGVESVKMLVFDNNTDGTNTSFQMYNNGTLVSNEGFPAHTFRNSSTGLELGQHVGGQVVSGYIQDLIICNGLLTGQNLQTLINYGSKYY